jgi:hypothetical protein
MKSPAEVEAVSAQIRRRYTIHVHHDLRRHVIRPWSSTITHGGFIIGWPADAVWHARSRKALVAKSERFIARDAQRHGLCSYETTIDEGSP